LLGVSLCIVNFNGARHLADSLGAVYPLRHGFADIWLVDNASTDSSVALVKREFPDVRIVKLAANLGPAAARNEGYRRARTDRILFVDNDVAVARDCVSSLTAALDNDEKAAIAVPRIFFRDNPSLIQYDGAACHYIGLMTLQNANRSEDEGGSSPRELDSFVSACFLIDRSRWGPGELFDESFFIYLEDHDLGIRTRLRGRKILAVPSAHCYHGSGTQGLSLRGTGQYQALRVIGTIRNRWHLILKVYQPRTLLLLAPALLTFELVQFAGSMKKGWPGEWLQAAIGLLRRAPRIVAQRREIQRTRAIPDRAILRGGPLPFTNRLASGRLERVVQIGLDRFCQGYWKLAQHLL
jgi:GT2 family glycosyltransferase